MRIKNGFRRIRKGLRWDGRRWAKLEVTIPNTKIRRKRRIRAETLTEAESAYREFRDSVLNPPAPAVAEKVVPTFEDYVRAHWPISRDAAAPISENTAREEWYTLDPQGDETKSRGLFALIGHRRIDQIDEILVEDLRAALRAAGLSNCSVNHAVRLLHKILVFAERRAKVSAPALTDWPRQMRETEIHQELSQSEIDGFLGAFDTGQINGGAGGRAASEYLTALFRSSKPLYVCALYLGLSRSDLLNLKWSSIDFESGVVAVPRRKTSVVARIPMSDLVREALLECRSRSVVSTEYVFLTPSGEPYSETTIRRYFAAAKKIAGIERPCRFHDLRHSFGSLLVSRGVPIEFVKKAMGHSNSRTTARYARVAADSMKAVADALNR